MKTLKITEKTHTFLTAFKNEKCIKGSTYSDAINTLLILANPDNNYLMLKLLLKESNNDK